MIYTLLHFAELICWLMYWIKIFIWL